MRVVEHGGMECSGASDGLCVIGMLLIKDGGVIEGGSHANLDFGLCPVSTLGADHGKIK